jgi:membrane associated rhomboid family serine protease
MQYSRQRVSALKVIVGINVAVFVLESLLPGRGQAWVDAVFGLSQRGISHGMVWQFVTHQFVHGSLFHLLVNMLGLWFAGRVLENLLGPGRFVLFYLTCGVAGGVLQLLLSPGPVLIGASGAVCGVVAAFSALYPEMQITALLFFVLPIRMRGKWLGRIIVIASVFLLATGLGGNIGNAAHLGGALAGHAIVRMGRRRIRT